MEKQRKHDEAKRAIEEAKQKEINLKMVIFPSFYLNFRPHYTFM